MKKIINIILLGLFFVFAFTFAQKNPQLVSINYYAGLSTEASLYLVIFAAVGTGLILGYLISMGARLRTRGEMKKAQQQARNAEQRLEKLSAQQELA